jgi:Xaa-Pro aminopeptidase
MFEEEKRKKKRLAEIEAELIRISEERSSRYEELKDMSQPMSKAQSFKNWTKVANVRRGVLIAERNNLLK